MNRLEGPPMPALVDYAKTVSSDLIVISNETHRHGMPWRRGFRADALPGTVDCAMLVVPETPVERSMTSFSRILCPTDIPVRGVAFDEAVTLAQRSGGKLTLVHALEGFPYESIYSSGAAADVIRDYRERVARISHQILQAVPTDVFNWCQVDVKVVTGSPHRSILAVALEINADLIVMGVTQPGSARRSMRSDTAMVLRRASCPVLVMPPKALLESSPRPVEMTTMGGLPGTATNWSVGVPA